MAAQGSLDHYPAVTALDFRFYPWCDGIPPMVPVFNLWIYLGTGSTAGSLIIGRLAVEMALTLGLVWHLAGRMWGPNGARVAILALSTSTLFLWSIGTQQETGMTGIALLAVASLLTEYRKSPAPATAVWVALAAVFGALCRDYNLILIPCAMIGLVLAKAPRRHLLYALGTAVLVGSPWYIRNAWFTGNPLFPHDLGGWLPTNDVHRDYMAAVRSIFTYANPILWHAVLNGLLVGAGALGLLALPGLLSRKFGARIIALLALVSLALCLIAIPSTAGGATYALRVMGPGLPLLAVAAGRIGIGRARRTLVLIGLGLLPLSVDAARRSWNFVWHPHDSPWPYTWTRWVKTQADLQAWRQHPIWPQLVVAAEGESIIVQQPDHHIALTRLGGNPVPLFSPEADVLTAAGPIAFDDAVNVLRQRRVRFVVLSDDQMQNTLLLRSYPVTARLLSMTPSVTIDQLRFYNLELIAQDLAQTAPLPESNP